MDQNRADRPTHIGCLSVTVSPLQALHVSRQQPKFSEEWPAQYPLSYACHQRLRDDRAQCSEPQASREVGWHHSSELRAKQ
jgi:hypothetical protein